MEKSFALLSENMRPRSPGFTTEGSLAALLSYLHDHHALGAQLDQESPEKAMSPQKAMLHARRICNKATQDLAELHT